MKPRIEKKVSKKLAQILGNRFGKVWIDDMHESWPKHYARNNGGVLSAKQKRQNFEQRVRVSHMPSIGGQLDYWGEGTDWHSVFYVAQEALLWEFGKPDPDDDEGWPHPKARMTGRWCIRKARELMARSTS